MTRIVNNCVALVCLCLFWGQSLRAADASHSEQIKWGNESVFNEDHNTLGLFSGVLGGQIVLAGGTSDDYSRWGRNAVCLSENAGFALYEELLSKPLAYGASITLSDGILCIGGRDSSQCYKDVFLVTMQQGKLNVSEDWPPLPFPLSNAAGALLDNKVYLFGGRKSVSPSRLSDSFLCWTCRTSPEDGKNYRAIREASGKMQFSWYRTTAFLLVCIYWVDRRKRKKGCLLA